LKTSEKVKNVPISDADPRCPMCLTICDSTMVLESGFDKELIGSDPKKLSVSYLQDLYENTRIPEEQSMCYGCKKIFNNAKD
jgi:hypothetical protein